MLNRRMLKNLDFSLVFIVAALLLLSIMIITSASANLDEPFYYAKKQLLWLAMGLGAIVAVVLINYNTFERYSLGLYVINLVMLAAVIFLGEEANGAQRWIDIGAFKLQPSEFAKILIILTFAQFLNQRQGKLQRFRDLIPAFLYIGVPMLLILKQPDLGTSLVFMAIMFGMLFVAGARPLLLIGIIAAGVAVLALALFAHFKFQMPLPLEEYQIKRLVIFLDPYQDPTHGGYQIIQSMVAIGSGGILGKGLFQGTQVQLSFLPFSHTDFIFAVVGEELGFLGTILFIILFFLLIYRGMRIAVKAKDFYGTLVATGICSMLAFHVLINVGMNIGMMPVTGIPLPFVSYGGSAMLTNMIALGLLFNVNIRRQKIMF